MPEPTTIAPIVRIDLPTSDDTRALGRALGEVMSAGDMLVLSGDLGAGKTTLTQGLGERLGVRGAVTSPTFVIARVHPPLGAGPALVHVDAYRLAAGDDGALLFDDLDLDADLADSVTVVEWGTGVAELLSPDRLELTLTASEVDDAGDQAAVVGDTGDSPRTATLVAVGPRWASSTARTALERLRIT